MKKTLLLTALAMMILSHPARADIRIVAVGPMTGQDAVNGEQLKHGATAAVDAINASGGVLGQKIDLVFKDDACDPRQSVAVANELGGSKIAGAVGHMCSGAAIPASKVYNEEGIVMVSAGATNPKLTDQGFNNVFRVCGRDDEQGKVISDFIQKSYAKKKIAIVNDKTAYGQGISAVVQQGLERVGIKPVLTDSVTRGERDYSSLISNLKQNNVDVLFYGGYHSEAGLIVRQMRGQGMKTVLIGGDGIVTKEFWAITGPAGEGTLMSFNADPRGKPEAIKAVEKIRADGYEPEGYTLYSYAAVQVLVEAIKRAGSADAPKVMAALRQGSYPAVIGDISFNSKGDVTKADYIMYQWTKGQYVPLGDK